MRGLEEVLPYGGTEDTHKKVAYPFHFALNYRDFLANFAQLAIDNLYAPTNFS